MRKTGFIIAIAGCVITVLTISLLTFTTSNSIIDMERLSWSPIVGVAIMAIGAVFFVTGTRKSIRNSL